MAERDELRGWKEIADFLEVSDRTAVRWRRERGLPVHRLPGGSRDSVFATRSELEAWQHSAAGRAEIESSRELPGGTGVSEGAGDPDSVPAVVDEAAGRTHRRVRYGVSAVAIVAVGLCAMWIVGRPGRAGSHKPAGVPPAPTGPRAAAGRAPITLQYVQLDVSRSDGWKTTIDIPDGGVGQTGGSPGHPLLVLRPRMAAAGLMLEIARADGQPVKDQDRGAPPMVLLLEPNVRVLILQPYRFWVRWVTAPPPR